MIGGKKYLEWIIERETLSQGLGLQQNRLKSECVTKLLDKTTNRSRYQRMALTNLILGLASSVRPSTHRREGWHQPDWN